MVGVVTMEPNSHGFWPEQIERIKFMLEAEMTKGLPNNW